MENTQGNPGLSSAVQAALQRRGGAAAGQGALTQVSPGAAMANPVPQPMNPSDVNMASAPPSTQPVQMPKFEPQDRTDLITLALIEQMKNDTKLTKEQTKLASQPAPQPMAQAPTTLPMGGGGMSWSNTQPMARSQMQGDYMGGMGKDYSGVNEYGTKKGF